jgi:ATP synthase F1 gamma subunit
MRPLAELKQDFEVTRGIGDIIDVLKTTALIQFHTFQLREKPNEDFVKEIETSLQLLAQKDIHHPFLYDREILPSAIVTITSDEGFLGELNTLLVNASLDQLKSKDDEIIILGERGARYLEDVNQSFTNFPGISDEVKYKEVEILKGYLLKGYRKKFGRIYVIYPEFISLGVQKVTVWQPLPYAILRAQATAPTTEEILIEPSLKRVLEGLIELWLGFKLLDIFRSSKQSEFAARIMHLEGSTQELSHLKQKLSFEYFRQVHALRDKVIREISASKILLARR